MELLSSWLLVVWGFLISGPRDYWCRLQTIGFDCSCESGDRPDWGRAVGYEGCKSRASPRWLSLHKRDYHSLRLERVPLSDVLRKVTTRSNGWKQTPRENTGKNLCKKIPQARHIDSSRAQPRASIKLGHQGRSQFGGLHCFVSQVSKVLTIFDFKYMKDLSETNTRFSYRQVRKTGKWKFGDKCMTCGPASLKLLANHRQEHQLTGTHIRVRTNWPQAITTASPAQDQSCWSQTDVVIRRCDCLCTPPVELPLLTGHKFSQNYVRFAWAGKQGVCLGTTPLDGPPKTRHLNLMESLSLTNFHLSLFSLSKSQLFCTLCVLLNWRGVHQSDATQLWDLYFASSLLQKNPTLLSCWTHLYKMPKSASCKQSPNLSSIETGVRPVWCVLVRWQNRTLCDVPLR